MKRSLLAAWLLLLLEGCDAARAGEATPTLLPLSRSEAHPDAFSLPLTGLSPQQRTEFFLGNSFFNQNWVSSPSSATSRAGLGPLFNARSCSGCHFKDGRGRPPAAGAVADSLLVRISVARGGAGARSIRGRAQTEDPVHCEPTYGGQLQGRALPGRQAEADVYVDYSEQTGLLSEHEPYALRLPSLRIEHWGYGEPEQPLLSSARLAPQLVGMGLLELVPRADIEARADPEDSDGDGISGRLNLVRDTPDGPRLLGRFGWKAEQPTLLDQIATAFAEDMGITSRLHPAQNHSAAELPDAGGERAEASDQVLAAVLAYMRTLALPPTRARSEASARGERVFADVQCDACHVPELRTASEGEPALLTNLTFHPYTDLLLHDLGELLADGRPSFEASGREWRTPPLWALGLVESVNGQLALLHDGRARSFTEAILFHGGEAEVARRRFVALSPAERRDLLAFLESI